MLVKPCNFVKVEIEMRGDLLKPTFRPTWELYLHKSFVFYIAFYRYLPETVTSEDCTVSLYNRDGD